MGKDKIEGIRILLVDDDEDEYVLLRAMLNDISPVYDLQWVGSYDEALTIITQGAYDVMFFDYHLGGRSGLALLQEPAIQATHIPVILLTGQEGHNTDTAALRAGAADYLHKANIDAQLVERTIRYAIERGRTLQDLRQSEARYRAVVDGQTDFLIRYDPDFNLTFVNQTYCAFRRQSPETLLGTFALEGIAADHREQFQKAVLDLTENNANYNVELTTGQDDRWQNWATRAIFDDAHQLFEFQSVIRDITERKRVEQELNSRLEELKTLRRVDAELTDSLDMTSVSTLALDSAMRLSGADIAVMGLYDPEGDELRLHEAYGVADLVPVADIFAQQHGVIGQVIRTGTPLFIPVVAQEPNCRPTTPDMTAQMLIPLMSHERVMGLIRLETRLPDRFNPSVFEFLQLVTARIAVALDNARLYQVQKAQLEEMQKLYEQVSELEQLKTDMIRIASHDLRNPIGVMQGYIEMLQWEIQNGEYNAGNIKEKLHVMQKMASRMRKITSDILSVDRIEQSSHIQATQQLDLTSLIREVCEEQRWLAQAKNHTYALHLPEAATYIKGDVAQIREALVNLVNNSIKYTPEQGKILISLEYDGDAAIFEVIDNGYGIPKNMQQRLFQPFYRAKTRETATIEGTGLGLHLVKNIIERHGGRIIFRSRHQKGSTFGFQLPVKRHE